MRATQVRPTGTERTVEQDEIIAVVSRLAMADELESAVLSVAE